MREPIVFFGSGPVAARSLELLTQDFDIEAVITKPQPPHHKEVFPVLYLAKKLGLKVFTPNGKSELSDLFATKPVKSRLGVVIDYGFIIGNDVIDYFPLGIINSHFSLLPKWRGADPITFSILSGDDEAGVSLMLIVEKMDEGPLLSQEKLALNPNITTPKLTDQLIDLSNQMLKRDLPRYLAGEIKPYEQSSEGVSYSRKFTKEDGVIDWNKPAEQVEREIRAFVEWPKSRTVIGNKEVIITKAKVIESAGKPGSIEVKNKELAVYCGKQALLIERLKPAGKKEMTIEAFLAGYKDRLVSSL